MSEVKARANVLLEEAAGRSLERVAHALRELGLTGYAADALCALARIGEATAGDLVARTGIPDSKIYYALNELIEKGLAAVQAGKPKTYRAVPPKQARARLEAILEAKHERERDAVTRAVSLLEPIQAAATSPATDLAFIVKGEGNVVARARALVESSRREVLLLSSDPAFASKLSDALGKVARKGRALRLAVTEEGLDPALARTAEVRPIVCDCRILVVDGQQMLTVGETGDGSLYGITSTDETLVRLGLEYWNSPSCTAGG